MRIARRAGHKRMAWKNGQGVTEEVAAFPPGSDADSFDWRLSIAHVGADGPFSVFAGVDRTIALMDGVGLALDLPYGRIVQLSRDGLPFSFSGDWKISSRNIDGPTIDLNMMTRRWRYTHRMERLTLSPGRAFIAPDAGWLVFNTQADIEVKGQNLALSRFDALSLDKDDDLVNSGEATVEVLFVTLQPAV